VNVIGNKDVIVSQSTAQGLVAFDSDGQIEPALAERWIVSDDGLSLVFRLSRMNWSNGKPVFANDVANSLKASFAQAPKGRLGQLFTAVEDVVVMTERVVEIRLREPRPNMLQLLAQPEFEIRHNGIGTGPFVSQKQEKGALVLRPVRASDGTEDSLSIDQMRAREIRVRGESAALSVIRYTQARSQVVYGGSFSDFPLARAGKFRLSQMVIDPANGLFGLAFVGHNPIISDVNMRKALSSAIDRNALTRLLNMPNWYARETILPAALDSSDVPAKIGGASASIDSRRSEAAIRVGNWIKSHPAMQPLKVALPEGPGARLLFAQLVSDWHRIGISAVSVSMYEAADLRLIDEVAPNASVNWYFTRLSCDAGLPCDELSDEALVVARSSATLDARAKAYARADQAYAANMPFIPLGNPFRWALTSAQLPGLRPSQFAIHPLLHLRTPRG
jgi:peptide/nickel transport system substrate-binding protein